MNVNDTEVAWSILKDVGYSKTSDPKSVGSSNSEPPVLMHYGRMITDF